MFISAHRDLIDLDDNIKLHWHRVLEGISGVIYDNFKVGKCKRSSCRNQTHFESFDQWPGVTQLKLLWFGFIGNSSRSDSPTLITLMTHNCVREPKLAAAINAALAKHHQCDVVWPKFAVVGSISDVSRTLDNFRKNREKTWEGVWDTTLWICTKWSNFVVLSRLQKIKYVFFADVGAR